MTLSTGDRKNSYFRCHLLDHPLPIGTAIYGDGLPRASTGLGIWHTLSRAIVKAACEILCSTLQMRKVRSERFSKLSKITQSLQDRAEIESQICITSKPGLMSLSYI